jgi:hypothetical protein
MVVQPIMALRNMLDVVAIGGCQDDQAGGHARPCAIMSSAKPRPNLDRVNVAFRGMRGEASNALQFNAGPIVVLVLWRCMRRAEIVGGHHRILHNSSSLFFYISILYERGRAPERNPTG